MVARKQVFNHLKEDLALVGHVRRTREHVIIFQLARSSPELLAKYWEHSREPLRLLTARGRVLDISKPASDAFELVHDRLAQVEDEATHAAFREDA